MPACVCLQSVYPQSNVQMQTAVGVWKVCGWTGGLALLGSRHGRPLQADGSEKL